MVEFPLESIFADVSPILAETGSGMTAGLPVLANDHSRQMVDFGMLEYEAVIEDLRVVLEADSRIAYALLFGSSVKGTTHFGRDVDLASGVLHRRRLDLMEIGLRSPPAKSSS